MYPFSSFAVANVKVHDPARRLEIDLPNLAEEIRPATETVFVVKVRDGNGKPAQTEITLAAVDEGIHSIKGYKNPDPYAWLLRPHRPDCRRAHYYDKVAYDFEKPEPGGDGAAERLLGKRTDAMGENWIRPVALWSGVVRTDKNGWATVKMNVPEFSGQLRLVAVACSDKALGSHDAKVFVRRPYMLRTSMPRFMLPGDTAHCRAVLFNQTDAPVKARVRWSFGGVLRGNDGARQIDLGPRAEADLTIDVSAGKSVGQGEMRWEVEILDATGRTIEHLKEVAPIPVRAPAAFQSHHELAVLKPGESRTFRNLKFLDDERAEIELLVGANPLLRLHKALQYVIGYPYGCVEQTTSRLMPLYLLRKNTEFTKTAFGDDVRLNEYIKSGIQRLYSMQTPSGGLGYWPGSNRPYPYGSIYALHFLTLVKNGREIDIQQPSFEALQRYVRKIAADWSDGSSSALYRRAYAVYVLALSGDLEAIESIKRFDAVTVPRAGRYLLAAALAQSTQDKERIRMYLANAPFEPQRGRELGGTLNSEIRNTAVELIALQQMRGDAETIHKKADELVRFLADRHYGSTQETAFIVTALAGYLEALGENIDQASATIVGHGQTKEVNGAQFSRVSHTGKGGAFTVTNTGKASAFVNVTTRGVPETLDLGPLSEGITVTRSFPTSAPAPADPTAFQSGRSCVIELTIACETTLENVVLVDLLPAGFEIENPRLRPDALPAQRFSPAVTPSFLEVRDDRLVLAFNRLAKGTHHFYYVVNAVTPGKYIHPAAHAECMYDTSIRGRSGVSSIEIR